MLEGETQKKTRTLLSPDASVFLTRVSTRACPFLNRFVHKIAPPLEKVSILRLFY